MQAVTPDYVAGVVSGALQKSAFSPGKLAHKIKADPRAMKNWFAGTNAPGAAYLIQLMATCDGLADAIMEIVESVRDGS